MSDNSEQYQPHVPRTDKETAKAEINRIKAELISKAEKR